VSQPTGRADDAEAAFVEAFLRANPGWLAAHSDLYGVLEPPARLHGDGVADHMAAMLRMHRERADGCWRRVARPRVSPAGCRMRSWRCSAPPTRPTA
jgi:hypothetical protein